MGKLGATWPQLNYFAIYGLWPLAVEGIRLQRVLWLWGRMIMILTFLMLALEIINLYMLLTAYEINLNDFVVTMNEIIFAVQSVSVMMTILVFERQLADIMKELGDMLNQSQLLMGSYARNVFTTKLRNCKITFLAFLSGTLLMTHWGISPLVNRVFYHKSTLAYHIWIPFDVDPWYIYFPIISVQVTVGVSWILAQLMFASLFISISEHLLGHFKVLCRALERLDYSQPGATKKANQYFEYHQNILKISYILRSATKLVFLYQFLCVTSIMCLNLYEITYVYVGISRFLNMVEYTLTELLIVALYCAYCNQLTTRSSELMDSAYFSGWLMASTQDRKSLWILMGSTRAPLDYGGMVKINWNAFINILKTAFSFYNFLSAVRTSKEG